VSLKGKPVHDGAVGDESSIEAFRRSKTLGKVRRTAMFIEIAAPPKIEGP
jgi:hypothetical protein